MFELEVYPACLDCRWRELVTVEVVCSGNYGSCTRMVTHCEKLPVCKLIEGQKKIVAERGE